MRNKESRAGILDYANENRLTKRIISDKEPGTKELSCSSNTTQRSGHFLIEKKDIFAR